MLQVDTDDTGSIGFSEIFEWCHGLLERARRARLLVLDSQRDCEAIDLGDLDWGPCTLRCEVRGMLERAHLEAGDLFRAWDRKRDNSLSR